MQMNTERVLQRLSRHGYALVDSLDDVKAVFSSLYGNTATMETTTATDKETKTGAFYCLDNPLPLLMFPQTGFIIPTWARYFYRPVSQADDPETLVYLFASHMPAVLMQLLASLPGWNMLRLHQCWPMGPMVHSDLRYRNTMYPGLVGTSVEVRKGDNFLITSPFLWWMQGRQAVAWNAWHPSQWFNGPPLSWQYRPKKVKMAGLPSERKTYSTESFWAMVVAELGQCGTQARDDYDHFSIIETGILHNVAAALHVPWDIVLSWTRPCPTTPTHRYRLTATEMKDAMPVARCKGRWKPRCRTTVKQNAMCYNAEDPRVRLWHCCHGALHARYDPDYHRRHFTTKGVHHVHLCYGPPRYCAETREIVFPTPWRAWAQTVQIHTHTQVVFVTSDGRTYGSANLQNTCAILKDWLVSTVGQPKYRVAVFYGAHPGVDICCYLPSPQGIGIFDCCATLTLLLIIHNPLATITECVSIACLITRTMYTDYRSITSKENDLCTEFHRFCWDVLWDTPEKYPDLTNVVQSCGRTTLHRCQPLLSANQYGCDLSTIDVQFGLLLRPRVLDVAVPLVNPSVPRIRCVRKQKQEQPMEGEEEEERGIARRIKLPRTHREMTKKKKITPFRKHRCAARLLGTTQRQDNKNYSLSRAKMSI